MSDLSIAFEHILTTMLRMARVNLKTDLCVFLQLDDTNKLAVRSADGIGQEQWTTRHFTVNGDTAGRCMNENVIVRLQKAIPGDALTELLIPKKSKGIYMIVPVTGQSRALGVLLCGPFSAKEAKVVSEEQLRSTGALCAVLTAHWRLYNWLSDFTPQMNHDLRTPLTAVQGSLGMVLGGVCGQVGGEVREMLEMAQKGCERTVRAIEEYLNKQQQPPKP